MSMKIIHTADWHLGHRLYNYDRTDDEKQYIGDHAFTDVRQLVRHGATSARGSAL